MLTAEIVEKIGKLTFMPQKGLANFELLSVHHSKFKISIAR